MKQFPIVLTGLAVLAVLAFSPLLVHAATITVCPVGCDSPTVAGGLAMAIPGDTVKVKEGTYVETVTITTSNLRLKGEDDTVIQAPPGTTSPIIFVNGTTDVTVEGLTVDGAFNGKVGCPSSGPPLTDKRFYGVRYFNSTGAIKGNTIKNVMHPAGYQGCQSGVAVNVHSVGGTSSVEISHNTISTYQKGGVVANMTGTTADIHHNEVIGDGPRNVPLAAQNGIQVGYGATGKVSHNTVSANSYIGPGWASGGILVFQAGSNLEIAHNKTDANDVGIWLNATSFSIVEHNKTTGSIYDGIALDDYWGPVSNHSVRNNHSEKNGSGIGLYGADNSVIENNQARENLAQGFVAGYGAGGNTFRENHADRNGTFGFEDDLSGSPANTYTKNHCKKNASGGSSPAGLCK